MNIAKIKAAAHAACITSIAYKRDQVHIEMAQGVKVNVDKLDAFITKYQNNIRVVAGPNSGFVVDLEKKSLKKFIYELEEIVADIHELIEDEK